MSEYARTTLVDHLGGDAVLIPNGVDLRSSYRGESRSTTLPGVDGARLGFLGRIDEPRKGLDVLLAAMPAIVAAAPGGAARHRRARATSTTYARTCPPELAPHVTFLGLVSDEDKARLLASVDLYVAPNTGGESFGIVLLEAMAAGTPVLASDLEAFSQGPRRRSERGAVPQRGPGRPRAPGARAARRTPPARNALRDSRRRRRWRATTGSASRSASSRSTRPSPTGSVGVREDTRLQVLGRFTRLKDES